MTGKVSYPEETDKAREVLIPREDEAIILDVLDQIVSSAPGTGKAIEFDNLSDMIISSGFDTCYKFLKQAVEILSKTSVTSLFLVTAGAHDERLTNILRSLFHRLLVFDSSGLRFRK